MTACIGCTPPIKIVSPETLRQMREQGWLCHMCAAKYDEDEAAWVKRRAEMIASGEVPAFGSAALNSFAGIDRKPFGGRPGGTSSSGGRR